MNRKAHVRQLTATAALRAWLSAWQFWLGLLFAGGVTIVVPIYLKFPAALGGFLLVYAVALRDIKVVNQQLPDATEALVKGAQIHSWLRGISLDHRESRDSAWHQVKLRVVDGGIEWTAFWSLRRKWKFVPTVGGQITRFHPAIRSCPPTATSLNGLLIITRGERLELLVSEPAVTSLYELLSNISPS